jgi:hypothetical protein
MALDLLIRAKRPGMVWGKPGIGKSAIIAMLATLRTGWQFLDFRLLIRDAVDMRGVPFVDDKTGRTMWAVPAEFPKEGKGIWFLDEINAAHPQVQAVAYQLVLDRAIGEYKLPDGWVILAAGNNEEDGAVVHRMPSPLRSRFVHLDLEADLDDWCDWALKAGIESVVIGFLRFKPELLHQFVKTDRAFPCPRTWEFISHIVKEAPDPSVEHALFEGTIGKGAAAEFSAFIRLYRELPNIDAIIKDPAKAPLPKGGDISVYYAVAAALGRRADIKNFGAIVTYLERFPDVEFNVMAIRDAMRRNAELRSLPAFTTWCHKHADVTLGAAA